MSQLTFKAALGFAQLIVVLGVLLFGPTWTFDYVQAWVYLLVFGGSAAGISVYLWKNDPQLLARRVSAGPKAETQLSQKIIQALAAVAFIGFFVLASLDHRFGWSRVPLPVVVVGDLLVVLGFSIVFLVFKENTFTSATIEVATDQKVISTGPYALVRHPMYSGALILLFGTPLALGSWWALLMFVPITLTITWRLTDEEAFLALELPGYAAYRHTVRHRLIPLVW